MNDEKTSTEAEQTKPGDMNASIERMIADLETIESIIRTTRLLAEGMENGGLKWATLSKAFGDIRHVLGPCAIMPEACFQKVYDFASGTGAFHTPKEIIDFVTANPPLGEVKDAPTPLDPSAPEMVRGGGTAEGGRGSHEPSGGGEHPVPHGHFAQGRCKRRYRLADGRALALETALRPSAQLGASQGAGRQRREGGLVP